MNNAKHNELFGRYYLPMVIVLLFTISSCSITRRIPDDQYLLDNAKISIKSEKDKNEVKAGELSRYIRQKPNKRILFFRFHLRLWNVARPSKEKGLSEFFRKVGEEPVILDTFQTAQTTSNLARYIESKGYYDSKVTDTTLFKKRRAKVKYDVSLGKPHRVRSINYVIEDPLIQSLVLNDTLNRLIKKGDRFDIDLLRAERQRIEENLREEGFFYFSREFITFTADTALSGKKVDLELVIKNRFTRNAFGERIEEKYRKHKVSNVYIYTNYDPVEFFYLQEENFLDTIRSDNQYFIYSLSPGIKLKTISNANLIRPGELYSESIVQKSRDNLTSLKLYRAVNIFFKLDESAENNLNDDFLLFDTELKPDSLQFGSLNCYIQLTPHTLQSYHIDMVGTNTTTSANIGFEGNLGYQHKNIFRGAETFDTKLRGMVQLLSGQTSSASSLELGGSVGLSFPRFIGPFAGNEHEKRYNPRTKVTASYSFQDRPEFTRTMAGMDFAYTWRSENRFTHTLTPLEVNVINIFSMSDDFWQGIRNRYEANSYKNQLMTLSGYNLIYSNQSVKKQSYSVYRFNFELSGNTLQTIFDLAKIEKVNGAYQLFNTNFSQFFRTDFNYVFNQVVDENNTMVYRLYLGVGLPYGNSSALPFDKKYFSGGSTGVRAWNARGLGPGSYVEEQFKFPNQTADMKLEANFEYRFKLVWMLEGALFLDAGNIWAITSADERPGAVFHPSSFYKQIALGTGTGIRLNLGFFTIRFDMGIKLYEPGIRAKDLGNPELVTHWIPFDRKFTHKDNFAWHFGIGYPF
ncbi:MAG: BamA/TamA family outer membrane protein [Tenuifilaceae bacterium]|nr:BamA/TamA family outer membrane protein [Tenuifilaceae bacterium]